MEGESLFEHTEFDHHHETADLLAASPEDIFSALEALEAVSEFPPPKDGEEEDYEGKISSSRKLVSQKSTSSTASDHHDISRKKRKNRDDENDVGGAVVPSSSDGQQRISHITVERNRRKQMNEHLTVLRSLMPCFYVKRVSPLPLPLPSL